MINIKVPFLAILGHFRAFLTLKRPVEGNRSYAEKFLLLLFDRYHVKSLCEISKNSKARFLRKVRTNEGELLGPIPSFVGGPNRT